MKILFVYYIPSGGVETLARQRSKALKQHGIEFDFLFFEYGSGIQNLKEEQVFITKDKEGFRSIIQQGQYDVVLVCSDHPFVKTLRDIGYRGKVIYEVQGLGSKRMANHWLYHARPIIQEHADAILTPRTQHLVSLAYKYFPQKQRFSFHNCLDTENFKVRDSMTPPHPVIGWVGRIEDNKNWNDVLEITAGLKHITPNLELWIFDDPSIVSQSEKQKFEAKLDTLGIRNMLKIHSNIPHGEMANYYSMIGRSGGFLCSTSKVEGFGYAVLEAMCCQCPVLCSDSDGVRNFVIQNITGKMYSTNQVKDAITQGAELLTNTHLRQSIIQSASSHVEANFSLDAYAANFLFMLKELGL